MKRSPKTVSSLAGGITIGVLIALMAGGAGAKAEKANRIHKVNVNEKGGATTIIVEGSKRVNYTAFRLSSPKRLVVDVANSHVRGIPSLLQKSTALIDGIAVSEYSVNGAPVSRIMINFKKDAAYRVRPRGDTLVITLNGPPKGKKDSGKIAQVSSPERTESDKALKQREQKARHELEQAKKLQGKARKEAAEARRLQEEARASQKEARELKQRAKEEIASAKSAKTKASSEAKKVKSRLKNANSVAKKARSEQKNINGELARLQSERDNLQAKAQQARGEAAAAKKRLAAIKNELKSETKKNLTAKSEIDRATQELEKFRKEAKSAKALVAKEQTSRKKLEGDVARLNKSLKHARLEKGQAEKAHNAASAEVAELAEQFELKEKEHGRAEDNAKYALKARKTALDAYKRAAEDEKDQLKAVLAKRENESREAAAKLYRLENDHRKARSALAKAKDGAKRAQEKAKDASVTEQELKIRADRKIARMDRQRALARKAALEAEQKAKKAASAKKAAEKKLARLRKEYDKKLRQVEKQAKLELAAAQSRLSKLDREKTNNAKQRTKLENQLVTAQKETDQAERWAKTEAKKAREVQEKLRMAIKKIGDQEARIDRLAKKAKKKNAKIPEYEQQLAAADTKIDQADAKISKQKSKIKKLKQQLARSQAAEKKAKKQELAAKKQHAAAEKQHSEDEKQRLAKKMVAQDAPKDSKVEKENSRLIELQLEALRKKGRSLSKLERRRLKRLEQMQASGGSKGTEAKPKAQPAKKQVANKTPMVTDITFESDGGRQKMLIHSNLPLDYTTADDAMGNSTMQLKNVALAPVLERTLDVEEFGGIVDKIHSYHADGQTQIEVDVTAFASNSLSRSGNVIEWIFAPDKSPAQKARRAPNKQNGHLASKTIHKEDSSAYAYPYERTAGSVLTAARKSNSRYSGRHIDLDFKDADIHNILRLLSDVGHVNIITSDDVKGSVTIRMRDVAWDHALDVILKTKSLGMVRRGNLIRVALLDTLENEREMEIARRKQRVALEPLETRLIPVSYAAALELVPRAAVMISERGVLQVDERTNVIIARDTVENLEQIEALVRSLDTQTPQVLIEGRIVEATSTYAREIGIQWGGDFSASQATGNPTGLAFPSTVGVAGGATDQQTPVFGMSPVLGARPNPNFAVNMPAATGTGSGGALGISLGSIANNANLNLRLSAMEESGTLKILSSPKILTLDNREAHIEQGTLIPYSQVSAQGVQTAFKEAKLNLTVTPHVTADGSVMLNLKLMRDEPDFNNTGARGDPTILKREAETELLVDDGHTAVIGGIFTRNHGMGFKKVPFFADIPIIGWLFKSKSVSDRRSEMLIFITPRIVNRAESIGQ